MKLEFKNGSGSIDPWSLEKLLSLGRSPIVTDDFVTWVRVDGGRTFKVLPDTEKRILGGEDPEKVLMDALETLRPGMKRKIMRFGHTIEIGTGEVDPKTRWEYMASGKSYLTTNGRPGRGWVYYDECPPFSVDDIWRFIEDIEIIPDNEKELDELITLWKWI